MASTMSMRCDMEMGGRENPDHDILDEGGDAILDEGGDQIQDEGAS